MPVPTGSREPSHRLAVAFGRERARLDPPTLPLPRGAGPAARGGAARTGPAGTDRRFPQPDAGWPRPAPRPGSRRPRIPVPEPDDPVAPGRRPSWWRRRAQRWLPPSLAGARVDPGRPGALALVAVVLVGAVLGGIGVWANRPTAVPVTGLPVVDGPAAGAAAPGDPGPGAPVPGDPAAGAVAAGPVPSPAVTAGPLVVSVVGRVARPGLVRIPDGARVADAVDAAGGALPGTDLTVLNLARRVGDGEQIAIGVPPAADGAPVLPAPGAEPASGAEPGGGSGATAAGGKVDLNAATAADLDALPGIGPVTAGKIIDWRTANGRFTRVEQLREVDGIGEKRFADLRSQVTV